MGESDFELSVRAFLAEHPEHLPGVARRPDPAKGGAAELVLDRRAALAFLEFCLEYGATGDPEKLRRSIERMRKDLADRPPPEDAFGGENP